MKPASTKLFVYGSLRSGFRNPAYSYLTKHFIYLGEAVVKGRFYDKGEYPVAIPVSGDAFIQGELYQLNNPAEFNWVIEQLDDYEGVNVEPGETPLYRRDLVTVFQEGSPSDAWIYWYNGRIDNLPEVPVGDVLKYLQMKNKP